jgi:hypothetical protein
VNYFNGMTLINPVSGAAPSSLAAQAIVPGRIARSPSSLIKFSFNVLEITFTGREHGAGPAAGGNQG